VLAGRPAWRSIPRGGKQLVLEARSRGGSWLEFKVIRANALGRFRATYRFRFLDRSAISSASCLNRRPTIPSSPASKHRGCARALTTLDAHPSGV